MTKLEELIQELCPDGVKFKPIKEVYQRLKGTPITAAKMKEIERADGDVRIFAGGKTVIDAYEEDIPKANITRVPAVLVQSRGVVDAVYGEIQRSCIRNGFTTADFFKSNRGFFDSRSSSACAE